jgi:hypothetical protein
MNVAASGRRTVKLKPQITVAPKEGRHVTRTFQEAVRPPRQPDRHMRPTGLTTSRGYSLLS